MQMKIEELSEAEFDFLLTSADPAALAFRRLLYLRCCLLRRQGVVWQPADAEATSAAAVELVRQQRATAGAKP
jgi:hypothetical protein